MTMETAEMHGRAREFEEAPGVLVVGHQTDGKSALVEALMGFQFNHVGGGIKTRRPIALHMTYDSSCELPRFRLVPDSGDLDAEPRIMSLPDIQAYIEAENMRLENEPRQFSEKDIIIKIEYNYCPILTIIDTPGLIAPAPGPKNCALQDQAQAVEALVRAKMLHKEYIILCLEDCSDWSNGTTRQIVTQVDPKLSRTIIVSTKLDTRIPQFEVSSDVEAFLKPPGYTLAGCSLGVSAFFTSVPSGRVGSGNGAVYRSNEEFNKAISLREIEDVACLEEKLGRPLSWEEKSRIGVSSLRLFLEDLIEKRFMNCGPHSVSYPLRVYGTSTGRLIREYQCGRLIREYPSSSGNLPEINQEIRPSGGANSLPGVKETSELSAAEVLLPPVRCLNCGQVIGDKWEPYRNLLQEGKSSGAALEALGLVRYCCKMRIMAHDELYEKLLNDDTLEKTKSN